MKTHRLHFLMTEKLSNGLDDIKELKKYSFSGKINFIFKELDNIIHIINYLKIDEKSKVESLETKEHKQVFLKKFLYKKIKLYHGKYNIYSMALLIRLVIRTFLSMVKQYGFYKAIEKIRNQKNKLENITKSTLKKFRMTQLLSFLGFKNNKELKLEIILQILLL